MALDLCQKAWSLVVSSAILATASATAAAPQAPAKPVPLGDHYAPVFEVGRFWLYEFAVRVPDDGDAEYPPRWYAWCTTSAVEQSGDRLTATWECSDTVASGDTLAPGDTWVASPAGLVSTSWWDDFCTPLEGLLAPRNPKKGYKVKVPDDRYHNCPGQVVQRADGTLAVHAHLSAGSEADQSMAFAPRLGPTYFYYDGGDDTTRYQASARLLFTLPSGWLAWVLPRVLDALPKFSVGRTAPTRHADIDG